MYNIGTSSGVGRTIRRRRFRLTRIKLKKKDNKVLLLPSYGKIKLLRRVQRPISIGGEVLLRSKSIYLHGNCNR